MSTIGTNNPAPKQHRAVKLPKGAKDLLDIFDEADQTAIRKAKALTFKEAATKISGRCDPPDDLELAILISGLEKSGESEALKNQFAHNLCGAWKNIDRRWMNNLRKAVNHIRSKRSLSGSDLNNADFSLNIIGEYDFSVLCSYAKMRLELVSRDKPALFRRGTLLAEIVTDIDSGNASIRELNFPNFKARLNDIAPFRKRVGDKDDFLGISIPDDVAAQLFADQNLPIPVLRGVVRAPVFVRDGKAIRVIQKPGFDASSGLYYAPPPGLNLPRVPDVVTEQHIAEARRLLVKEALGDFMFDGVSRAALEAATLGADPNTSPPASLLNMIGFMLEQTVRPLIHGPVLTLLVTKPLRGAGASLLMSVAQMTVEGKSSVRPLAKTEDERRKAAFSALLGGAGVIIWDNVTGAVDSPVLAMLLSENSFADRVLSRSEEREVPVRASFAMTGNRPAFSEELRRRLSLVNLDPQSATPEKRTGFRHEDLYGWVEQNRGHLVWALMVLARNWVQHGCPQPVHAPIIGRFESYRNVIGGIIEAVAPNWTTWQANRDSLHDIASSDDDDELTALVAEWWEDTSLRGKATAADLAELATNRKVSLPLRNVQGEEFTYASKSLGNYLRSAQDRVFDIGGTPVKVAKGKRAASGTTWQLVKVEELRDAPQVETRVAARAENVVELSRPSNGRSRVSGDATVAATEYPNPFAKTRETEPREASASEPSHPRRRRRQHHFFT